MQKALVTGGDGFIGSHLVEALLARGYCVRALVNYNSFNSWGWLDNVSHANLEIVAGDIRDPFLCDSVCKGVDVIFHLAALIAIPYSYAAPQSYVETNVNGTMNLCQAAMRHEVSKFIQTSTSEVYGTAQYVPIDEAHPLQPQSPYSASKIGADSMAMSYFYSFGLPVTIARPFNTYGPRQSARAIIPTIISQIAAGKDSIQVGDLSPTRDFNYVADTCGGFIAIAEAEKTQGETINIATNSEVSMKKTLDTIKQLMNSDVTFSVDPERIRPKDSEVFRLWGDNTKLVNLTGFTPSHSLELGLQKTIDWFTQDTNLSRYKTNVYNV